MKNIIHLPDSTDSWKEATTGTSTEFRNQAIEHCMGFRLKDLKLYRSYTRRDRGT